MYFNSPNYFASQLIKNSDVLPSRPSRVRAHKLVKKPYFQYLKQKFAGLILKDNLLSGCRYLIKVKVKVNQSAYEPSGPSGRRLTPVSAA